MGKTTYVLHVLPKTDARLGLLPVPSTHPLPVLFLLPLVSILQRREEGGPRASLLKTAWIQGGAKREGGRVEEGAREGGRAVSVVVT